MLTETTVDESVEEAWKSLITKGMKAAIDGLSQMVELEISVNALSVDRILVNQAPQLVGGSEVVTTGVYLSVSGTASGHILILYAPETAFQLIDMLLGNPDGTTTALDEMERSVLGEIGNVMGSHFLNTLSDYTGLDLRVSPPEVMMDMAGAILDPTLAELMAVADEATVVDSSFSAEGREVNGKFLVMPNPNLQRVLMVRLGADD